MIKLIYGLYNNILCFATFRDQKIFQIKKALRSLLCEVLC